MNGGGGWEEEEKEERENTKTSDTSTHTRTGLHKATHEKAGLTYPIQFFLTSFCLSLIVYSGHCITESCHRLRDEGVW
jgi:hypothetical protein